MIVADAFGAARQRIQLHPLNVDFDQIETREMERIKADRLHVDHLAVGIVDRLADELCVFAFAQLETAETSGSEIIRRRHFHRARLARYGGVDSAGIEAIVDRDVTGECIVDALLGFEGQHHAPAGHVLGPLDGVDADIGAAVDRDNAVAVMLAAYIKQFEHQVDFGRIIRGCVQELKADAICVGRSGEMLVKSVQNERAVVGSRGDECDLARRLWHASDCPFGYKRSSSDCTGNGRRLTATGISVNGQGYRRRCMIDRRFTAGLMRRV